MAKEHNEATRVSCSRIEEALAQSPAFTRVDANYYVVRQGTAYVYIQYLPCGIGEASRCQHCHGVSNIGRFSPARFKR